MIYYAIVFLALVLAESSLASTQGNIKVFTTDDRGLPLKNVQIRLEALNPQFITEDHLSDENGRLFFINIPPGDYRVVASKKGFHTAVSTWVKLKPDSIFQMRLIMIPELASSDPVESDQCIILYDQASPSIAFTSTFDHSKPMAGGNLDSYISQLPGIFLDSRRSWTSPGSDLSDARGYLDGIPLFDPLDRGIFMLPPVSFCDSATLLYSGISGQAESSWGNNLQLTTKYPSPDFVSGSFQYQGFRALSTQNSNPEAKEARDYWESVIPNLSSNEWDSEAETSEMEAMVSIFYRAVDLIVSGHSLSSNALPESDYLNSDATENNSLWMKSGARLSEKLSLEAIFGYEDRWERLENAYLLRGLSGIYSHETRQLTSLAASYRTQSGLYYRLIVTELTRSSESGPPGGHDSILKPGEGSEQDADGYDIIDFYRDGKAQLSRIQLSVNHLSMFHGLELGSAFQNIDIRWLETYRDAHPEESPPYHWIDSNIDNSDWELCVWGQDRWLPTRNIELNLTMRYDRYNYYHWQPEHLTPRFSVSYFLKGTQYHAGFDRVVTPPTFVDLYQKTNDPGDDFRAADQEEPLDPTSGFRWFAGAQKSFHPKASVKLDAFWISVDNPIFLFASDDLEYLNIHLPIQSYKNRKAGLFLNIDWKPADWINNHFWYSFSHTEFNYPFPDPETLIQPCLENRYPHLHFIPIDRSQYQHSNDITHQIYLNQTLTPGFLSGVSIEVTHKYNSGLPYTPLYTIDSNSGNYYYGQINSKKGPGCYILDISAIKNFSIGRKASLELKIALLNALNSLNSYSIDPENGETIIEPFTPKNGYARTVTGRISIVF